jgi:RNA-directed DNA polymerase
VVPQKKKVQGHLQRIKEYLKSHLHASAQQVIRDLNPLIRGWANYYRHVCAKETFSRVRHGHWRLLWRWAKRRHPNKPSKWVKTHYFRDDEWWTFATAHEELFRPDSIPIHRYTKVAGRSSPYDRRLRAYWERRRRDQLEAAVEMRRHRLLLRYQGFRCSWCGAMFLPGEPIQKDHRNPRHEGGTDDLWNLQLLHLWCHQQRHQVSGYK